MITLAFTGFLFGAGLIVIPIILHLLKRKPRVAQPFPALLFLHATIAQRQSRNRLRKFIVLLLRIAIFLLLALAFAWPYLADISPQPTSATVILWDGSFSTQVNYAQNYMENAFTKLMRQTDNRNPMLIGAVNATVQWSGDFSGDKTKLANWLQTHKRGFGSSSFREAIRQADNRLKSIAAPAKKIIIITDRQWLPWENVNLKQPLTPGVKLEVMMPKMMRPPKNCAITQAVVQSKYFQAGQQLILKINFKNFNAKPAQGRFNVSFAGRQLYEKKITLPANTTVTRYIQLPTPKATLRPLAGKVDLMLAEDELPLDNHYYFSVNPIVPPQVFLTPLIGHERIDFIRTALEPTDAGRQTVNATLAEFTPDCKFKDFAQADLLVIQDARLFDSLKTKIDRYLEAGGNVIIVWQNSPQTVELLEHLGIGVKQQANGGVHRFEMLDFEHPLLKDYMTVRAGSWFDILFFDIPTLKFPRKTKIIASFENGIPAITEAPYKNGKVFVLCSQLDRQHTNWPTFGSFLPFWRELLLYTERNKQRNSYSLTVGTGKISWPKTVMVIPVTDSQSKTTRYLSLASPGNFMVKSSGKSQIYSINVPVKESATELLPKNYHYQQLVSQRQPAKQKHIRHQAEAKLQDIQHAQNYWWILLSLAFALSCAELVIANRTVL